MFFLSEFDYHMYTTTENQIMLKNWFVLIATIRREGVQLVSIVIDLLNMYMIHLPSQLLREASGRN